MHFRWTLDQNALINLTSKSANANDLTVPLSTHNDRKICGVTGGGAGGQSAPPETSDSEISADLPGKERQGKKQKGENGKVTK